MERRSTLVAAPRRVAAGLLAGGLAALLAVAGLCPAAFAKDPPKPPPPSKGDAAPAGTVSGVVRDDGGSPIQGAEVVVLHESTGGTWRARTDGRGAYSLAGLPEGASKVMVRSRSRVPFQAEAKVPAGGVVRVDATLVLGVRFAGRITDVRGAPVAGARVQPKRRSDAESDEALRQAETLGAKGVWADPTPTTSADDGTFRADGLAPGASYALEVTHPHHLRVELPGLPAEAGETHDDLDVMLEDAAWISGVVVDAAGKPLAKARIGRPSEGGRGMSMLRRLLSGMSGGGIRIDFRWFDEDDPFSATSDAQGRFTLGMLPPGEAKVEVSLDGYFRSSVTLPELEAGKEHTGVRVALEQGTAWLEGVVVDDRDRPVADAKVSADGSEGAAGTGTTDAKGAFRLKRVLSRGPVSLSASKTGHHTGSLSDVALNSTGLKIVLPRSARFRVRLLAEDGECMKQVWFEIRAKGGMHFSSESQTADGVEFPVAPGDFEVFVRTDMRKPARRLGSYTGVSGETLDAGTVKWADLTPVGRPEPDDDGDDGEDDDEGD